MNKIALLALFIAFPVLSQNQKQFYLTKEDQKYFKNDSMEGNNQFERIELNVKEINKLHGEINQMKAEIATLKEEVEKLKKKNP